MSAPPQALEWAAMAPTRCTRHRASVTCAVSRAFCRAENTLMRCRSFSLLNAHRGLSLYHTRDELTRILRAPVNSAGKKPNPLRHSSM